MVEDYKNNLRKLIQEDKITLAIKLVTEFSNSNDNIRNKIILIGNRLESLEKAVRERLISYSDEEQRRNQINSDLLALVNRISDDDYTIYIENSERVLLLKEKVSQKNKQISDYEIKVKELEDKASHYQHDIEHLSEELKTHKEAISEFKNLLNFRLVKLCEKCNGSGFIIERVSLKFNIKIAHQGFSLNKEKFRQQIEEQIEEQLDKYVTTGKITPIESLNISPFAFINREVVLFLLNPNPFKRFQKQEKEFIETFERKNKCDVCKVKGFQSLEE